jgi:hypothetical protein
MHYDSESNKKPYSSPTLTKLTVEQAKRFLTGHANCSHPETMKLLEALRREERAEQRIKEMSAQQNA